MDKTKLDIKLNKSSTYFLPYVDEQLNFQFLHLLRNSYLSFKDNDEVFCVLYEWTSNQDFTKYEGELMNHILFLDHQDYGKYVLYKFKLTRNMQDAKKLFVNGKYSMFTEIHKASIDSFLKKRGFTNADKIKKILSRDESVRADIEQRLGVKNIDPNQELSSAPDMFKETFSNHIEVIKHKIDTYNESN